MIEQLIILYDLNPVDIQRMIEAKTERLKKGWKNMNSRAFIDAFRAAERAETYNRLVKPRHPKTIEVPAGPLIPISVAEQIISSTSKDLTKPTAVIKRII